MASIPDHVLKVREILGALPKNDPLIGQAIAWLNGDAPDAPFRILTRINSQLGWHMVLDYRTPAGVTLVVLAIPL